MAADHTGFYLHEIGKIPLLTAEEEIILNRQILEWLPLRDRIGPFTKKERRIERIGKRAHKRFMEANLRLVVSVAKKYSPIVKTLTMMDLIQEGNVGLVKAVEKFDGTRGYKFSTYAYWWIRQAITRSIQMQDRMIRLPGHVHDKMTKIRFFVEQYYHSNGCKPSLKTVSKEFDIELKLLESYLAFESGIASLDGTPGHSDKSWERDKITLKDTIPDPSSHAIEELDNLVLDEFFDKLPPLIASLPKRDQEVIQMRFFSGSYYSPSAREISEKLGLHVENVRSRIRIGIERMRIRQAVGSLPQRSGVA